VILLDEVEKAHPDVHEIFYQVFDKGWMEDGEGRRIDFRNTTILLTSNTGAELIESLCEDPASPPEVEPCAKRCSLFFARFFRPRSWGACPSCPTSRWARRPWAASSRCTWTAWSIA
jgi:ATP-dependent Clp protease ATP-binding subunit ClpA